MNSPRAIVARLVKQVLGGKSLSSVLPNVLGHQKMTPQQKAFIQALSYETLRWYHQLKPVLDLKLKKPMKAKDRDLYSLLIVGLCELQYFKTKPYAVINETVQGAKALKKAWGAGLINAILREYQRDADPIKRVYQLSQQQTLLTSHPDWLADLIKHDWPEKAMSIMAANNKHAPMVLRVNQQKTSRDAYLIALKEASIDAEHQAYTEQGIIVKQAIPVEDLPCFDRGFVSVQDGAAQMAVSLLDLLPNQTVLDVCAAPGGKITHILETQPDLKKVVAWDKSADRMQLVQQNVARLGLRTAKINYVVGDGVQLAAEYQGERFDRILLDAPCSGTGVIRRHPDIKCLRQRSDITETLPTVQLALLRAIWPLLSSGGRLLYATCSIMRAENEAVIDAFTQEHTDAMIKSITKTGLIKASIGAYCLPGLDNRDGFYYACIEKRI